jgi:hypothetical protein
MTSATLSSLLKDNCIGCKLISCRHRYGLLVRCWVALSHTPFSASPDSSSLSPYRTLHQGQDTLQHFKESICYCFRTCWYVLFSSVRTVSNLSGTSEPKVRFPLPHLLWSLYRSYMVSHDFFCFGIVYMFNKHHPHRHTSAIGLILFS